MSATSITHEHQELTVELPPLTAAIRLSGEGILVVDLHGKIHDVNDAVLAVLGRGSPDEIIGKNTVDLLLPKDHSRVLTHIQKRLAGEQTRDQEFELVLSTGERRWVEINPTVLNNASGQPVGSILLLRDITTHRQTEEALRQSQERFALISRGTKEGLWDRDLITDETFLSPAYKEQLGYAEDELTNSFANFESRLHPDDHDYVLAAVREHLLYRTSFHTEFRLRTKSGDYRWFESYGQGLWNDAGQPIRMAGSLRDITARKEANTSLERQVTERTAELAQMNDLLAAHVKELTAVNQELESLNYTIAHDLRTPLRHIHGFADLLRRRLTCIDDKSGHYLTTISNSAKEMGVQIDALLTFLWTGRKEMQHTQVALGQLVQDIVQERKRDTLGRDILWEIGSFPLVKGDPEMLRVVVNYLIDNAIKYTRTRTSVRITIDCETVTAHEVVWFVRDNGVGFDMQYAHKIFGVFQRLHHAEEYEGAGIGLALARRIIQRHGGRIWVEAAVEQGATFYVALPISTKGE